MNILIAFIYTFSKKCPNPLLMEKKKKKKPYTYTIKSSVQVSFKDYLYPCHFMSCSCPASEEALC